MYQLFIYGKPIGTVGAAKALLASPLQPEVTLRWVPELDPETTAAFQDSHVQDGSPLRALHQASLTVEFDQELARAHRLTDLIVGPGTIVLGGWHTPFQANPTCKVPELTRLGLEGVFKGSTFRLAAYGTPQTQLEFKPYPPGTTPALTHPNFPHLTFLGWLNLETGEVQP